MAAEHLPVPPGGVPPSGRIGILGGGQLGRMLAMAAARLGFSSSIYCPQPDPPAARVAGGHIRADWEDRAALTRFAQACDLVTFEFENIPVASVQFLADRVPVRPSPESLRIAQDRLAEKEFLRSAHAPVAEFAALDRIEMLDQTLAAIGTPAIIKTRRMGYDGKGQMRIHAPGEGLAALKNFAAGPCIIEREIAFDQEVALVCARDSEGNFCAYDLVETIHEDGILRQARIPARLDRRLQGRAEDMAREIADRLDHIGVLAVEMFVVGGDLLVNEIAPRVHNSGHWTLDACPVSQFEQHIRAICGWPLAPTRRHSDAVMINLLGDAGARDWKSLAETPAAALHLYDKTPKPNRKIGHLTRLYPLDGLPPGITGPGAAGPGAAG